MTKTRSAYLFRCYFNQSASEEEKAELMAWISLEENVEEAKELMDKAWEEFHQSGVFFTDVQSEEMLRDVLQEKLAPFEELVSKRKKKRLNFLKAAATILILIATGSYFLFFHNQENKVQQKVVLEKKKEDVAPGGNRAILTLANGTNIILDSLQNGTLPQKGNSKVRKINNNLLSYSRKGAAGLAAEPSTQAGGSTRQPTTDNRQQTTDNRQQTTANRQPTTVQYNTLITPRGGQYQLILPDGSKVWLNAASSIRFPTSFSGKERKVDVAGEVYFEIAKNASKPFIVIVKDLNIKVLGTHFNVNAYDNEIALKTTLLEGAIKVTKGAESELLKPGQQASINQGSDHIKITKADLEKAKAWKNGLFHFEGEDMTSIMHKLSRWYDVNVSYEGVVPAGHYSGIMSRNTNLSEVLKVLGMSGMHFKIEGKNLIVIK